MAEKRNLTIWSLEQDAEWFDFIAQTLVTHGIRNVELKHVPLKDFGGYVWYEIDKLNLPKYFELVLCDGPFIFDNGGGVSQQWRYGLVPVLSERSIGVKEILLDDASEPRAANLLDRWKREFSMGHRLLTTPHCAIVFKDLSLK